MSAHGILRTTARCAGLVALASAGILAQAPAGGGRGAAPQPAARGGYSEAATLPARIMEFRAEPATIKAGETVTLTWAVENPRSINIEPAIGRASARGTTKVTPTTTTTYTLTVTGVNGTVTRTATVTIPGTQPVAATTLSAPIT